MKTRLLFKTWSMVIQLSCHTILQSCRPLWLHQDHHPPPIQPPSPEQRETAPPQATHFMDTSLVLCEESLPLMVTYSLKFRLSSKTQNLNVELPRTHKAPQPIEKRSQASRAFLEGINSVLIKVQQFEPYVKDRT